MPERHPIPRNDQVHRQELLGSLPVAPLGRSACRRERGEPLQGAVARQLAENAPGAQVEKKWLGAPGPVRADHQLGSGGGTQGPTSRNCVGVATGVAQLPWPHWPRVFMPHENNVVSVPWPASE